MTEPIGSRNSKILEECLRALVVPVVRQAHRFAGHSTVTDFARLRGWSTSVPMKTAV
jgi:hypothetical protein